MQPIYHENLMWIRKKIRDFATDIVWRENDVGKIQRFGDNSEIEHVRRILKKSFAIVDVS